MQAVRALELEHRVKAPPEIVFSYFTDPVRHAGWIGSEADLDPRPGGIYRVRFAPGIAILGEYVAVEPPHRVVYTFGWETEHALPGGVEAVGPGSTTVEVALERDGDETVVRIRHYGFTRDEYVVSHGEGWRYALGRLTEFSSGRDPGGFRPEYIAAANTASPAGDVRDDRRT